MSFNQPLLSKDEQKKMELELLTVDTSSEDARQVQSEDPIQDNTNNMPNNNDNDDNDIKSITSIAVLV